MTPTDTPRPPAADAEMIRALVGSGPAPRRPRTDTRLVDPQIAPDLPGLAGQPPDTAPPAAQLPTADRCPAGRSAAGGRPAGNCPAG